MPGAGNEAVIIDMPPTEVAPCTCAYTWPPGQAPTFAGTAVSEAVCTDSTGVLTDCAGSDCLVGERLLRGAVELIDAEHVPGFKMKPGSAAPMDPT